MPYVVDVGLPVGEADEPGAMELEKALRYTDTIEQMADVLANGVIETSGMGFGFRDLQITVASKRKAKILADEIADLLEPYTEAYVGVYYELPYRIWRILDRIGLGERFA